MASRVVKEKQPGPQSSCLIRYLEGLANRVCVSQLEEPCSPVILTSMYSNPHYKAEESRVCNTLDRYLVKK